MTARGDPFKHHPELRGLITDPRESLMRSFTLEKLAAVMAERGLPQGWWYPDAVREAMRRRTLERRRDDDLWVFAYGSLMWDPGVHFVEVRRAHLPHHARRFILKDIYGGRGTRTTPGLMAALDTGSGCDGLAFRIAQADLEVETEALWRREQVAPAYISTFAEASIDGEPTTVLTFVADHSAELIAGDMTREEQIACLVHGTGFMGSSLDYLRKTDDKLHLLGVGDEDVSRLRRDAEAAFAALSPS